MQKFIADNGWMVCVVVMVALFGIFDCLGYAYAQNNVQTCLKTNHTAAECAQFQHKSLL